LLQFYTRNHSKSYNNPKGTMLIYVCVRSYRKSCMHTILYDLVTCDICFFDLSVGEQNFQYVLREQKLRDLCNLKFKE